MALDINGYNATFKAFADFAAKSVEAGKGKAIARASADAATGALAGRDIKVSTSDTLRGIFKWSRSDDDKAARNRGQAPQSPCKTPISRFPLAHFGGICDNACVPWG